jgi:hypothetical protein
MNNDIILKLMGFRKHGASEKGIVKYAATG